MSGPSEIHELKDISHDIETFNRVIVDAHQDMIGGDEHAQDFASRRFELLRGLLVERLFKAAANNPFLHLELVTGKNGIPAYELIPSDSAKRGSRADTRPIGGIAAWSTVKLDTYNGDATDFNVESKNLRFKLGTVGQTISEGGRLIVVDDTPIPDEPSTNE